MATILYKNGAKEFFATQYVQDALAAGWSVSPEPVPEAEEESAEEASTPSLKELRAEAKEKGIEGAEKMRTATLLKELGYEPEGE